MLQIYQLKNPKDKNQTPFHIKVPRRQNIDMQVIILLKK